MTRRNDLLANVDALLPRFSKRADAADAAGQVADETIQELIEAGVFATLAPKAFGGLELDLETYSQIVQRISAVSPSLGWTCSFLIAASWRLLIFGREGQEEIFGCQNYVLGCGAAAPISGVEKVDGGYLLTGQTAWNSGASHAQWFQINGLVSRPGEPSEMRMFAVPRSEVDVLDTWHILGMKATASRDVSVDHVFVPERRAAPFLPVLEGRSAGHRLHANPMYHIPYLPFGMTELLPVVAGTHRGAVNAFVDRTRTRLGTISGARGSDKVTTQIRMAQGMARADMAEQLLAAMVVRIMAGRPDAASPASRAAIKLHASMVTTFCLDSVNDMARSVGGDAFRDGAPFQRYFRDMNTVARHAFLDPDTAAETFGKLQLGLPVADPLI